MILLVDNYDSFTFNLYQVLGSLAASVEVVRNDRTTVPEIRAARFEAVVLSPGPGTPDESGVCLDVLRELDGELPILGVCLGHQALCQVQGARVVRARLPVHGKASPVDHDGTGILRGLPRPFLAGRYHSLVVDPATLPPSLRATARTGDGELMAVERAGAPTWGVQFHPESILTPEGDRILVNFLDLARQWRALRHGAGDVA